MCHTVPIKRHPGLLESIYLFSADWSFYFTGKVAAVQATPFKILHCFEDEKKHVFLLSFLTETVNPINRLTQPNQILSFGPGPSGFKPKGWITTLGTSVTCRRSQWQIGNHDGLHSLQLTYHQENLQNFSSEILSHLSIIGGQWRIINVTGVEGILGVGLGHGLGPNVLKTAMVSCPTKRVSWFNGCLVLV